MTIQDNSQFEVGKKYEMNFITDSDLKPKFICISRTEKTVKFQRERGGEVMTRRVKNWGGHEYVTEGSYSMAPTISSKRVFE